MNKKSLLVILASFLSVSLVHGQFVVRPLFMETTGVSNQGLVAGYEGQGGPYSIWDADLATTIYIGGTAPGFGVGGQARFSDDGTSLCGTSSTVAGTEISRYNTVTNLWTPLGSIGFPLDSNWSGGFGISGDGNTVVGNSWADTTGGVAYTDAVAWNPTEGIINLGSRFDSLARSTRANAANYDGSIVVGWQDFNGPWKSAVWRKNPTGGYYANEYLLIDSTGDPNDEFNQLGECSAISSDGNWIGGYGDYANNNEPWIWSRATGAINLGTLVPGGTGNVSGINSDGTIVTGWFNGSMWGDPQVPFIWTPTGGLQNLNTYITNVLGYSTGPIVVYNANCLSSNGDYIAGYGIDTTNFNSYAFRLHRVPASGINNVNAAYKINIYPNPASDFVTIENNKESILTITSIDGRIIERSEINGNRVVDVSKYASGIYLISLQSGDKFKTGRLVKN